MKPLAAQKQLLLKPMHLLSHPRANQHRDHRCDLQCRSIQANHNALFGAESKSAMSSTYSLPRHAMERQDWSPSVLSLIMRSQDSARGSPPAALMAL
ncbi:hypothetical protein DTO164E3_8633 [Paecilomyces variotii]|nr:hypothetical protein DTO164E3_8633 [Paecilomyces variotii]KAJ9200568.1 hypothetical protein DTO032I3_4450 [Paecilomyces variotii]KAJ9229456.1 hypothetical protein DTO169E5_8848 [Paecilomyces variotii]KAJ9278696.1 hypothetical protein DTO021D3_4319 [Paecilomyces variotii]KAJ9289601.1 hypothetical protein DTO021C3_2672 [Paecilomyces variotii]